MTEHHPFHSNTLPEVDVPLELLVREHTARARKLQSEAMAASLANGWRGLTRGIQVSARWLAQLYRRAQTRRALMACSDRTLRDIGVPRAYIHLAARGIDVGDPVAVSKAGLWPRLAASLRRTHARRTEQLRVYRELMAYSDHELEEIGLRRVDIPSIARTA